MSGNADLQNFIERLAGLLREKKQADEMIADLRQEIDSAGFDKSAVEAVVKRIMLDEDKARKAKAKEEAIRLYAENIGQSDLFG